MTKFLHLQGLNVRREYTWYSCR